MDSDKLLRLLTIFESSEEAEAYINILRKAGHIVRDMSVDNEEDMLTTLDDNPVDLILGKLNSPGLSARQAIDVINNSGRDIPFIAVIPAGSPENKQNEILKHGARDTIPENHAERLKHVIKRELSDLKDRRAHRRCEQMLHETEKRARALIDSSRDAIAYVHDGMHIYANNAYLNMFGYEDQDDIQGLPIMDMVSSEDHSTLKEFLRSYTKGNVMASTLDVHGQHVAGKQFKITMEFSPASMEGEACTQIIIRDQTMSKELEQKLSAMTQQDLLTGLYNRNFFIEQLDMLIARAIEGRTRGALLFITLDKYDELKETDGISTADMLLTEVAGMLQSRISEIGIIARYAGPVFVLLIDDVDTRKASNIAASLCKLIHEHICEIGEQSITTSASIGISLINETATHADECIKRAEKGCQQAQKDGGNRNHLYNPAIEDMAEHEQVSHWGQKIKQALKTNHFKLVFQPIVSLHGEPGAHYEVLVRMLDDENEEIAPREFIPAAEQMHMMNFIDRWVIMNTLMLLSQKQQAGEQTRFFVKLSASSLCDEEFLGWFRERLHASKIDPNNIVLEISEETALNYLKQAKQVINGLRELNCRTSLENFGVEQNTFQSLKHISVNYIKVHMDLIINLPQSMENQEKVKSIAEEASSRNIQTIAAFVEDANSLAVLWQCSVNFIQGHFLQQPGTELNYDFEEAH
ncbi:MAG: EAL domain-containing protein [Gammaproteobacteria bacterium]|nr:EAL domain-containing protein [Gammaproteobacteria bacterium]